MKITTVIQFSNPATTSADTSWGPKDSFFLFMHTPEESGKIYEADLEMVKWLRVPELKDPVLFSGRGCSLCVPTEE